MKHLCLCALATVLLTAGCNSESTNSNNSDSPIVMDAAPPATVESHGHASEGPHHGTLIELGKEEFHAELVHDDNSVTIYILDSNATKATPIDAADVSINMVHDGKPEQFKLVASPDAGDPAGKSSRFTLQNAELVEDHYSYTKDPSMPTCGIGDASVCKKQGGGCCTDLNSYFITLARARGIPARLNMGVRLPEKNRDKLLDAGYRCWVEYFVANYGWISADVVEADTPGGLGHERWLSGLTSRRIWLNQGREFAFADKETPGRINNMTIGYAEIDGQPVRLLPEGELKPQLTRTILYTEESDLGR